MPPLMSMNHSSTKENVHLEQGNPASNQVVSSNTRINTVLSDSLGDIISTLREIEKKEKGFIFNEETLHEIFRKNPRLTPEGFKQYFLTGTYNKNILMCAPEIIGTLNLDEVTPGDDLIQYMLGKISISEDSFNEKVLGKLDVLTFPNLAIGDIAQGYFYDKLSKLLPGTQIVFGDMPEIRENFGINQFNCDSVGFIDPMGNKTFNTCLLKLLKTPPIPEKLNELNALFSGIKQDIFIGGSTFTIPFDLPENLYGISMPKTPSSSLGGLKLLKNGTLINSMGYLNSAYYADKTKASFVLGSHNIAEPMHAGRLTVINNDPTNRYNHNWLISYFGEKAGLLLYMEGTREENQSKVDEFLQIPKEEMQRRYTAFQKMYESEIKPLIYGILHNFLRKNFPEITE